jgi:hypothetical protein
MRVGRAVIDTQERRLFPTFTAYVPIHGRFGLGEIEADGEIFKGYSASV